MKIPNIYESKNYKLFALIPIILLIAGLGLIFFKGVPSAVELKGGILITLQSNTAVDTHALEKTLSKYGEVTVRQFQGGSNGVEIELENSPQIALEEEKLKEIQQLDRKLFDLELNVTNLQAANEQNPNELVTKTLTQQTAELEKTQTELKTKLAAFFTQIKSNKTLKDELHLSAKDAVNELTTAQENYRAQILADIKTVTPVDSYSFRQVGPSLSQFFLSKTREILAISFIVAAIAIFVIFRALVPSFAVIFGAAADIIITLGAMALFDIPLSLASLAGLLMLIGFSLDTDVMLTMRVLKQGKGTPAQRCHDAFTTGILMNLSTIAAFGVLAIVGLYLAIPVYYQLGVVAVIGAIADFFATWGINAMLILEYAKKKHASI